MNRGRLKMNKREFAVGRRWWQHVSKPAGGYVLVREQAMLDAWQKLSDGEIQLRDLVRGQPLWYLGGG